MLFGYEWKKIWRRVSPLLVVIVLSLTAIATMVLTLVFFNHTPQQPADVSTEYAALQTKINNWNTTVDRYEFSLTFDQFYHDYKTLNDSVIYDPDNKLLTNYATAKDSFNHFYLDYYSNIIYGIKENSTNYLLVQTKYIDQFNDILSELNNFFNLPYPTNATITDTLKYTNPAWDDESLQSILDNLFFVQEIKESDLYDLKDFFVEHPANQVGYDYSDAYTYALNRFWMAIATTSIYDGELSQYEGFSDYQNVTASTRVCKLAEYRLQNPTEDFATPFTFGNIYNNSQQVSLFDYVFTNMEMAMIPVTLLVMIWAACTFFTDHHQNTLVTPIAAGKKRTTIILTKTTVILSLTVLALLLLTGIYLICGLLFFKAYLSPDILCLFNGTKILTISASNYFVIYFLNLVFKLLPLIAICGLFSFAKSKPFVIVGLTTFIYALVIVANNFLGVFDFYQYVPLMGLDPIRYFGANLFLAPMPTAYNLWYTFPAILSLTALLYTALIYTFRHHDF